MRVEDVEDEGDTPREVHVLESSSSSESEEENAEEQLSKHPDLQ